MKLVQKKFSGDFSCIYCSLDTFNTGQILKSPNYTHLRTDYDRKNT